MKTDLIKNIIMEMRQTEKLMPSPEMVVPDISIIEQINLHADIDAVDTDGRSILMYAIIYGRPAVVSYLIGRGANVNLKDKNNYTPLHFATQEGVFEIVEMVLNAGGCVNAKDVFGNNPIMRCETTTDIRIFELLLERGENPFQKNDYGVSAADCFAAYPEISAIISQFTNSTCSTD